MFFLLYTTQDTTKQRLMNVKILWDAEQTMEIDCAVRDNG